MTKREELKRKFENILSSDNREEEKMDMLLWVFEEEKETLQQQVRQEIEEVTKTKFPIGEREWCIECSERITKKLLSLPSLKERDK